MFFCLTVIPARAANPSPRWLKLLHYQQTWVHGWVSTIDSPTFFFAEDGKNEPVAELVASRRALATGEPTVGSEKLDPQCAFPARSLYFKEEFGDIPRPVLCEDFAVWQNNLKLRSLSIVFSSAYLGNPASMLGHTFLKLNLKGSEGSSLLDYGASFAAFPEDQIGIKYFIKGLTGAYKGVFTVEPYYTHVMGYSYRENRDLWEYELDLTTKELEFFLAHFWELYATGQADYFFLDDNCSSLLIEVLDALRPELDLGGKKEFFVLPQQTIKTAVLLQKEHRVKRYPSERSQFRGEIALASQVQINQLKEVLAGRGVVDDPLVLDLALRQINLRKADSAIADQDELRAIEENVLRQRAKLGKSEPKKVEYPVGNSPEKAHEPTKVSVAYDSDGFVSARARLGQHDLLDPGLGFEPYYQMNYFDLRYAKNTLDFSVTDVLSLVPFREFEHFWSWRFAGGLRSSEEGQQIWVTGGAGVAFELIAGKLLVYTLPGVNVILPGKLEIDLAANLFWAPADWLRFLFSYDGDASLLMGFALDKSWSLEGDFSFATNRLGMAYRF